MTGGSDGIGLACVERLLAAGWRVGLLGRSAGKMEKALEKLGPTAQEKLAPHLGDVTDVETRKAFLAATRARFGLIGALVNNARGATPNRRLEAIDEADFDHVVSVNLASAFALCRLIGPEMRARGYGRIVNVASVAGRDAGVLSGPQYAAAKAGMIVMARHLARELAPDGITVNTVAPGVVANARMRAKWEKPPPEERARLLDQVPVGRLGEPHEIAGAVLYFLRDDAGFTTGACLDVNGGYFRA